MVNHGQFNIIDGQTSYLWAAYIGHNYFRVIIFKFYSSFVKLAQGPKIDSLRVLGFDKKKQPYLK